MAQLPKYVADYGTQAHLDELRDQGLLRNETSEEAYVYLRNPSLRHSAKDEYVIPGVKYPGCLVLTGSDWVESIGSDSGSGTTTESTWLWADGSEVAWCDNGNILMEA